MFISTQTPSAHGIITAFAALGLTACASVGQRAANDDPRPAAPATDARMTDTIDTIDTTAADAAGEQMARYEVIFVPSWNPATHPLEYPLAHAKHGILTPAIGATHDSRFAIFAAGKRPTPGLERLSEMGKHDPLDAELGAAMKLGKVGGLIRFSDGSPGPVHPSVATTFEVSRDHSQVSLVGMIAPSPDWFYGISGVELDRGGKWASNLVVPALAWDSGGDAGTTYLAEDIDLVEKQPTKMANPAHFAPDGVARPVGYFVFKQIPLEN